ncbi:hypothetical protein GCM10027059_50700 [Myceligenerans halotolerans]
MADVSNRSRQPQGSPDNTGGQFATENHAEAEIPLTPVQRTETPGADACDGAEIATAASMLKDSLAQMSAAYPLNTLFNHGGRAIAFGEYVAILHDPSQLLNAGNDDSMSRAAADACYAVRSSATKLSAPSELNEIQRQAAIEHIAGKLAVELASAANARSQRAAYRPSAEVQHAKGRIDGYGAALVELVHAGQPSVTRSETNSKLADIAAPDRPTPPTARDIAVVAIEQRTEHRTEAAESQAAAAYDDLIAAHQELVEAERDLDREFDADPDWDHHSALEDYISTTRTSYDEANRAYNTATKQMYLARAPQIVREVDEALAGAREVSELRSRDSIELDLARFRGHHDRVTSALAADGADTDPATARLQQAAQLLRVRVALLEEQFTRWHNEQTRE